MQYELHYIKQFQNEFLQNPLHGNVLMMTTNCAPTTARQLRLINKTNAVHITHNSLRFDKLVRVFLIKKSLY